MLKIQRGNENEEKYLILNQKIKLYIDNLEAFDKMVLKQVNVELSEFVNQICLRLRDVWD